MNIDNNKRDAVFTLLMMVLIFVVSRYVFWISGVRFDATPLEEFWQILDAELLKYDLLKSVYYAHSQPPLFNLIVGLILKTSDSKFTEIFHVTYMICGAVIYFSLYGVLRSSGFQRITAMFFATVFIISPVAILYENWLFYTWPVTALIILASYGIIRYEVTGALRYAIVVFVALAAVCLIRSMFHIVFLVASIFLLIVWRPQQYKQVVPYAVMVVVIVGAVFVKNTLLFGFFGSSSWLGMSLWNVVNETDGRGDNIHVDISDVAAIKPFSPISAYPKEYGAVPERFKEVVVLASEYKRNGQRNLNHIGYISISEEYQRASWVAISRDASNYLRRVAVSWRIYFKSSTDYWFLEKNAGAIRAYIDMFNASRIRMYVNNVLGFDGYKKTFIDSFENIAALLGVLLYGVKIFFKPSENVARVKLFVVFSVMTILYVAVIGNSLELGENNRFRVMTDPLLYVLVVIVLRGIYKTIRNVNYEKK